MAAKRRAGWGKAGQLCLMLALVAVCVPAGAPAAEVGGDGPAGGEQRVVPNPGHVAILPLVLRGATLPLSAVGVHMLAVSDARGLQQAKAARTLWLRTSSLSWARIEPVRSDPPNYRWGAVDELSMANASAANMTLVGNIHFTPAWAQAIPGVMCGPIAADRLDEFAQFLRALVARYRQPPYNVHYWELWNEPDVDPSQVGPSSLYGCYGNKDDAYFGGGAYAEMLKVAYPAIKSADPLARVMIGGLLLDCDPRTPPPGKDCKSSKFLEGILRAGGGPFFDLVAFHAYTYGSETDAGVMGNPNWPGSATAIPEKVGFLRGVLEANGAAGRPLIATEVALQCFGGSQACLDTQAMYVPRAFAEAVALGLRGQVYYEMINEQWRHVGLLLPDLSPKPSYRAYAVVDRFLGSVEAAGAAEGYPPGIQGYAFDRRWSAVSVDVIWSADGSTVQVPLPAGVEAFDREGVRLALGGSVAVGRSPVYIVWP